MKQSIAGVPNSAVETPLWALRLISMSQRSDFRADYEWAKWCRSVACAGLEKDDKKLERLECEMTGHLPEKEK